MKKIAASLAAALVACSDPAAPPLPTKLAFKNEPSSTSAGTVLESIRIEVQDAAGNQFATGQQEVTVSLQNGGGAQLTGTTTAAAVNGIATFTGLRVLKAGTGYSLRAVSNGLAEAASAAFSIAPGAPRKIAFDVQPSGVVAGTTITPGVSVTLRDSLDNLAANTTVDVSMSLAANPGGAKLTGGSATAAGGTATFSGLSLDKAGAAYKLKATLADNSIEATSNSFDVSAGPAASLGFTSLPTTVEAGATIPAVVTVRDQLGNTVTTSSATITLSLDNASGAQLAGTTTATAVNGVATFSDLRITKSGSNYALKATSAGSSMTATSGAFAISAGAAANLSISALSATREAGTAIPTVQVRVRDQFANTVTSSSAGITLSLENSGGAQFSGTTTVAAVNGIANFSDLRIVKAGAGYTIKAASAGVTEASSNSFTILPGRARKMAFQVQPSDVVAGVAMSPGLAITLRDSLDNLCTNFAATVILILHPNANPNPPELVSASATASGGIATFSSFSVSKAGTGYTVRALLDGDSEAKNGGTPDVTSNAFNVSAGPAAGFSFTSVPTSVEAGATMPPVVVAVTDAFGNATTSTATVTLSAVGADFAGTSVLTGTTTVNAVNGIATFNDVALDRYGSTNLRATSTGLNARQAATRAYVKYATLDADSTHACGLTTLGVAYCWGNVAIGDGTTGIQSNPRMVSGGRVYTAIATGAEHTCALSVGTAYCWGNGGNSQIGDGALLARTTPVAVSTASAFTSIAVGWWHSCGITTTGTTLCWGYNQNGQLGDGTTTDQSTPVTVQGGLTFAKIVAGRYHTCGLTVAGAAYCWGSNARGQVGDNGGASNRTAPTAVAGGIVFTSLSANGEGTCGLTAGGIAYCWGLNDGGQVGDGTQVDRFTPTPVSGGLSFKSISTSGNHACGISSADEVWCWGSNAQGQGENGAAGQTSIPLRVGSSGEYTFSVVVAGDRNTFGIGQSNVIPSAGVLAYSWGLNGVGQLGRNSLVLTLSIGQLTGVR